MISENIYWRLGFSYTYQENETKVSNTNDIS